MTDLPGTRPEPPEGSLKFTSAQSGAAPEGPARRSVVLPLALIGVGTVLLLSTLGVLAPGTWWALARLWPLLLIAWGVERILPRQGGWGQTVAMSILALAVIGSLWLSVRPQAFAATESHPILAALPSGAQRADVQLGVGVAHLTLARGERAALLAGDVQTLPGERLEQAARLEGNTAVVSLQARSSGPVSAWPGQGADWTLRLAPSVPLTLSVTTGVGRSQLDLRGLQVRELKVTVGVGQSELTLPETGPLSARLIGGVGALTLAVPPQLPARISVSPGVGRVTAGAGLAQRGQDYVTAGYDSAPSTRRAEVHVTGGVGSVRLDTLP